MKKVWLAIVLAISAAISSGCSMGKIHIALGPEMPIVIVNECYGSDHLVASGPSFKDSDPILYSQRFFLTLGGYSGTRLNSRVILVQGYGPKGEYLGSTSQTFVVTRNGSREKEWRVNRLTGGLGCKPLPKNP